MIVALRATLAFVALSNTAVGAQAALSPHSFYDGFPLGRGWVAALPPFNEHLTTDVGGFYLAFAVLVGWAAARPQRALVMPLAVAWAVFGLIHLAWHAAHLGGLARADAIAQTTGLATVLAPSALAAGAFRRVRRRAASGERTGATAQPDR